VAASGASIALPSATQVIIGRADPVSQFFPDIDLTPHGALDNGVGRRHLRLFVSGGKVMIEDLESTNGTMVNGQRLAAHQPQPLRNADQVIVGRLVMQYQE
jgi:pSer/pThr/pTyr-binding forkhead associated (FHA) protein